MSIDEGELRSSLSTALDEVDYGPLPLNSVISQGKTVVRRRRLTALAGALAVVVVAVAGPVIAHDAGRPAQPVTSAHYHVTVHPPGAKSGDGLISFGRINQRHWQIVGAIEQNGKQKEFCFSSSPPGDFCRIAPIPVASEKGQPVSFDVTVGQVPMPLIGDVRSDVRFVVVSLSNGQQVTLQPVAIFGHRHSAWVAMMVPNSAAITKITAYSAKGEIGYTVPFGRGILFATGRWFAPGQPPSPHPTTFKIASGRSGGKPWAKYAFVGPWGTCIAGTGIGGTCVAGGIKEFAVGTEILSIGQHGVGYGVIVTRPAVSYVIVHFKHALPVRVPAIATHGVKVAGFVAVPAYSMTRWVGFSASGQVVSSGRSNYRVVGRS